MGQRTIVAANRPCGNGRPTCSLYEIGARTTPYITGTNWRIVAPPRALTTRYAATSHSQEMPRFGLATSICQASGSGHSFYDSCAPWLHEFCLACCPAYEEIDSAAGFPYRRSTPFDRASRLNPHLRSQVGMDALVMNRS
jgi:hypothetical protein